MQTRLQHSVDNGPWSDESTSEIMFDFTSEESLCTDSSEILTLEVVEPPKDHIGDALELNRQLHASLQRKQEEISALKEKNAQLKELAKQAEHYATILDVLISQPAKDSVSRPATARCSSTEPSEWHFTASESSWLPSALINSDQQACSQTHGVKRQLWPTDHNGYSNNSDHEPFYKSSNHEPNSSSSGHETYSKSSDHELYLNSSGHETYSKRSDHELYLNSSGHETYSKDSDQDLSSGSSGHETYSKDSDLDTHLEMSNHAAYSKGFDHKLYSNGANSSTGGINANSFIGENPDPKRLKLNQDVPQDSKQPNVQPGQSLGLEINRGPKMDQDFFQLDSEDQFTTEHVNLKATEDSSSNKTGHHPRSMIQVYGAFHGLKVVMARCSTTSDLSECEEKELVCFKTSIREHSTVKTNVFPHGKTFTSHTPDGSCRFLWVPNQK